MSTYTPIASLTLTAATSSITFAGIPQNYTDLVLVSNLAITNANTANVVYRFNSDTGSNYSDTRIQGNGTTASSNRSPNATFTYANAIAYPSGTVGENIYITNIFNYSNTTTYKTQISRANRAATGTDAIVGLWRSTSAITSITVLLDPSDTYKSGSTFSLYGISNSPSPLAKATGGNAIYSDGTYWIHMFTTSGTFIPSQNLTNVDYLIVGGGGGGGGSYSGGGGGGGGVRSTVTATGGGGSLESKVSFNSGTSYTVSVGAGGYSGYAIASNGSSSSISGSGFSTLTSSGGGRGGGFIQGGGTDAGANGGSGGGGSAGFSGGTGTSNQGYGGGTGTGSNPGIGGGGGGSGGAGSAGTAGNGVAVSITGVSTNYAGGGGGGRFWTGGSPGSPFTGGLGGGGTGAKERGGNTVSTPGSANTGGGGGGGSENDYGSSGGSGIVIIRYSV